MKKVIFSMLLSGVALIASNSASVYKSGLLLPANGKVIYERQCATCHGDNGKQTSYKGSARVTYSKITGMDTDKLAKELKDYRGGIKSKNYQPLNKYGYGAMMRSVTTDLSWDEIDAVAKYVNSLK
ncbi:MAG: cytochrome c [Arcobacteraceae bacterium]|nr:cytochrome c [Arcobacteraceae bacterium]